MLTSAQKKNLYANIKDPDLAKYAEKLLMSGDMIVEHMQKIIKDRTFVFKGDETHSSVRWMKKAVESIDSPPEYEWQKPDVHEENVIRQLAYDSPNHATHEDPDGVIAGTAQASGRWMFNRCSDCAAPLFLKVKGNVITLEGEGPCESNAVFEVIVDFPTGEVLADDWPVGFQEWRETAVNEDAEETIDDEIESGGSINELRGTRARTENFAANHVAHFFVGNTCPRVILTTDGELSIRPDEDDLPGKKLASICTDLWWATMVDVALWEHMMGFAGVEAAEMDEMIKEARLQGKVFQIPAGKYKFTYEQLEGPQYGHEGFARRVTGVRIGDC